MNIFEIFAMLIMLLVVLALGSAICSVIFPLSDTDEESDETRPFW